MRINRVDYRLQSAYRAIIAVLLATGFGTVALGQSEVAHTTPFVFPTAYATITSAPSSDGASWITLLDATGDYVERAQPFTLSPHYGFTLDSTGTYGEALESSTDLNYFSNSLSLLPSTVGTNSLPTNSCTSNISAPANHLYTLDYQGSVIDYGYPLGGSSAGAFAMDQGGSVGSTPIALTGNDSLGRYFVISQNIPYGVACNNIPHSVTQNGSAAIYSASDNGLESGQTLTLGKCPVYGVASSDGKRAFVLNRGDDSITVIDTERAAVDRTIALPIIAGTHAGPVYAEYSARSGKLVVANYENDTVSIINAQLDRYGADGPAFGTVVATVDLWSGVSHQTGKHPAGLSILPDGTRAYVANQEEGSVAVLDLKLNQVVSTVSTTSVVGSQTVYSHPRSIAVISNAGTNSLFTKVYIATPDSNRIQYISAVDNAMPTPSACPNSSAMCTINGTNATDLRVSTQNTTTGVNTLTTTRFPGAGQPCLLPKFSPLNLADCQSH